MMLRESKVKYLDNIDQFTHRTFRNVSMNWYQLFATSEQFMIYTCHSKRNHDRQKLASLSQSTLRNLFYFHRVSEI